MARKKTAVKRTYDARPDTLDFRDRLYEPTLVEVPLRRSLEDYRKAKVPVLDQGEEGACTGFGLATVAHYLLRTRKVDPDTRPVSPRMLYEMARLFAGGAADWVVAPNQKPADSPDASRATKHTNIDEEPVTLNATLARILGHPPIDAAAGGRTSAAARELRQRLS
jgi:hypothetical protein